METSKSSQIEKIYLSISHEVKDFASWKVGFDNHNAPRKEAGLVDIFAKQNANNKNGITAFFEVKDLSKAKAFISNPQLKEAMEKAGVTSAPVIEFYKTAEEYDSINASNFVTTISHGVKDYSVWKEVYDSAGELKKGAEIKDNLVLRSLSDQNVITVLGTSSSTSKFNEFISNPALKAAMEKAGATSKPEVAVLL